MPKALKRCPKCKKSPNLVTLIGTHDDDGEKAGKEARARVGSNKLVDPILYVKADFTYVVFGHFVTVIN